MKVSRFRIAVSISVALLILLSVLPVKAEEPITLENSLIVTEPDLAPSAKDPVYAVTGDGSRYRIPIVNEAYQHATLQLYTPEYGEYTDILPKKTLAYTVVSNTILSAQQSAGNRIYIPDNGAILAINMETEPSLASLSLGDYLLLDGYQSLYPEGDAFLVNDSLFEIDVINPIIRNEAVTAVYTSDYTYATTRTNIWGLEFSVRDNIVTEIAYVGQENNLTIPQDGYVISVQAGSPDITKLNQLITIGTAINLQLASETYFNVARIAYDAMDPRTREDNPAGWDELNDVPFPGFRGPDQLIIYSNNYGKETGTNEWGYEVTVNSKGTITSMGGNNSTIPDSGFVISTHGVKADKLRAIAALGTVAVIDQERQELILIKSPETYVKELELLLLKEQKRYKETIRTFQDVDLTAIKAYLDEAETLTERALQALSEGHLTALIEISEESKAAINNAHFTNHESRSAEVRGVWIRPKERSLAEVEDNITRLKSYNINTIFLETHYGGYSIYPSDIEGQELNPYFEGFDVLDAYIDVAHSEGMAVHAWTKVFMPENGLAKNNPEIAMHRRDGAPYEMTLDGIPFYWLSPAHPIARDLIRQTYAELARNYDLDGYQYDYIRYPDIHYNDMGYEPAARASFQEEYGIDPLDIEMGSDAWEDWRQFREDLVNSMVYELTDMLHEIDLDAVISTAVASDFANAPYTHMQNPEYWIKKGYIDLLLPMAYVMDPNAIATISANAAELAADQTFRAIGLGDYLLLSEEALVEEAYIANRSGAEGTVHFELEALSLGYGYRLAQGIYSKKAISPIENPKRAIMALIADIKQRIEHIYVPKKGIKEGQTQQLKANLNQIIKNINDHPEKLLDKIDKTLDSIETMKQINPHVKDHLHEDITYIKDILLHASNSGLW